MLLVVWLVLVGLVGYGDGQSCQAGYSMLMGTVDSAVLVDTDNSCIRALTFGGDQTLLSGVPGSSGYMDGSGSTARFKNPAALAVTPDNTSIVVVDYGNNRIRKVDLSSGAVSTFAGSALTTYTIPALNIDGAGSSATFYNMRGISVLRQTGSFVVSVPFPVLRVVTYPVPVVSTVLGSAEGSLGVVDGVLGVDGLVSGVCTYFPSPDGAFFISTDTTYRNIRRLDYASLQITTLAGSPGIGRVTGCVDGYGTNVLFTTPIKVLFSSSGQEVFIADRGTYGIRKLNLQTFEVSTLIGTCPISIPAASDGVGVSMYISDMVLSDDGAYIYAAQSKMRGIRRIEIASLSVTTIGASSSLPISSVSGFLISLKPAVPTCTACTPGTYSLNGQQCISCAAGTFCQSAALPPSVCQSGEIDLWSINRVVLGSGVWVLGVVFLFWPFLAPPPPFFHSPPPKRARPRFHHSAGYAHQSLRGP
jgi:DNA-binding beta-propeller fold protein YncE